MSEQKSRCCGAEIYWRLSGDAVCKNIGCPNPFAAEVKEEIHNVETPKKRKPVQIAGRSSALYALCDDGTVWELTPAKDDGSPQWNPLPNIPQEFPNDSE